MASPTFQPWRFLHCRPHPPWGTLKVARYFHMVYHIYVALQNSGCLHLLPWSFSLCEYNDTVAFVWYNEKITSNAIANAWRMRLQTLWQFWLIILSSKSQKESKCDYVNKTSLLQRTFAPCFREPWKDQASFLQVGCSSIFQSSML